MKRLCCQNNFVIDYAKTLYKPEFPEKIGEEIKVFTSKKLPAFFEYAKDKKPNEDKKKSQIEERNKSFVNKLYERIPNKPINTRGMKLGKLEYTKMMSLKLLARLADGVITGSGVVDIINKNGSDASEKLTAYIRGLKAGMAQEESV